VLAQAEAVLKPHSGERVLTPRFLECMAEVLGMSPTRLNTMLRWQNLRREQSQEVAADGDGSN